MIVRTQSPDSRRPANAVARPTLRRRTMCQFIALALFGGVAHAATPPAFSPAWFASKQANAATQAPPPGQGTANAGGNVFTPGNVMLQQRVQQSIANLDAAAQAVAAQMAAQKGAQSAAQQLISNVTNGLGDGGLKVDRNVGADPSLWQNANQPTQTVANGRTNVEIKQTAGKAIMSWESFNVGSQTTVHFDQTGGNQTGGGNQWIALNRINDPSGKPSQILGQIKAEGTVYLLNRNGMIFGGGAQVDTHSLVATSLDLFSSDVKKSNAFFMKYGVGAAQDPEHILSDTSTTVSMLASSGDPTTRGAIRTEKGASITAGADGMVILAAPSVQHGGSIVADDGLVVLSAAPSLTWQPPVSGKKGDVTYADFYVPQAGRPAFSVVNTGLIQARRGAIHWIGDDMRQDGVVVASTSLSKPGSIVFDRVRTDDAPKTTFGGSSVTTILPEKDGETTSSSADANKAFVASRVDVNTAAVLEAGALMEVPAGNVTFNRLAYVAGGATIDVSGLANVTLPMSALIVLIPRIGQNELANSPLLRDSFLFTAKNVPIDSSRSGTRADGLDWVGSPILNVAGYVNNVPRTVDQLMIRSGNIAFNMDAVIRTGAKLRLEGGFINYLPGYVITPRLQGANGLLYDIASADPNVDYTGFAGVYTQNHSRWGVSESYVTSPLLANVGRWDPGFIRGGDAGTLSFGLDVVNGQIYTHIIDGDIDAHAYSGREQIRTGNLALGGALDIRVRDIPTIGELSSIDLAHSVNYVIQSQRTPIETYVPDFDEDSPLPGRQGDPNDPSNPFWWRTLSTAMLDNAGIRKLRLDTPGTVLLKDDANLRVVDGGEIQINAAAVNIQGKITAHGGKIGLLSRGQSADSTLNAPTFLTLGSGALLDASGRWVNDTGRIPDEIQGRTWINGGSVTLSATKGGRAGVRDLTPDISLESGSVVDVSGGGYVGTDGRLAMNGNVPVGRGGDVTIDSHSDAGQIKYGSGTVGAPSDLLGGVVDLGGQIVANGFEGGGTLTLHVPGLQVGGEKAPSGKVATLYLDPGFFSSQGFSNYSLISDTDAVVAPGTQVTVQPTYMIADQQALLALPSRTSLLGGSGGPAVATTGTLDAFDRYRLGRKGDGISIDAGASVGFFNANYGTKGAVDIGKGASVTVDPGRSILLRSQAYDVVDGTLSARGGSITMQLYSTSVIASVLAAPGRSIWLAADSVLDASGVALIDPSAQALPSQGEPTRRQRTGVVLNGGSIALQSDRTLIAQRGAQLRLDGASDTFDVPVDGRRNGMAGTSYVSTPVWSDGGSLNLEAAIGLYFDGAISAHGGASEARGGRLSIGVHAPNTVRATPPLIIQQSGWLAPTGTNPYLTAEPGASDQGNMRFAADRLTDSGLDDLILGNSFTFVDPAVLTTSIVFAGDVDLHANRSIQLVSSVLAGAADGARGLPVAGKGGSAGKVSIEAPYVALIGKNPTAQPSAIAGTGEFSVDADFIDIGGRVNLSGFAGSSFQSTGDIRFSVDPSIAYPGNTSAAGWLYTLGNLDFTGTRVYPATDYRFLVDATNPSQETTVRFHQAPTNDTSTPLSAGGALAVAADHIEQGGTLWVPSGAIALGTDDPAATLAALGLAATMPLGITKDVHLAPGSVTSVSLGNAVLPYGTTVDGKDWHYDGNPTQTSPVVTRPPEKSLSIAGDAVAIDAGATVDLSGGGHVQAIEWVPGTGGSRDVLAQSYIDYSTSAAGVNTPLYKDNRPIYAVLPGYDAPIAAHDAALEKGAGAGPSVGQAVYLSGVPGLPDGVYTLLPSRYATLPGAFRVVQNTGVADATIGRSVTAPDGSHIASGYFVDALTGARDARASSFIVQSAATWGQYSDYTITSADTFFANAAARNDTVAPRLGADAGRLTIAATSGLTLGATLKADPAKGGRGSQVDIAGDAIQVLGASEAARDGYLHVSADELSLLGAGSLLIGGKRTSTDNGDQVDVLAGNVLLSNDAAHPLQGSEVILVADGSGGITLDAGSALRAGASTDDSATPLLIGRKGSGGISGDGALLRVSGKSAAPVVRSNVTGLDGASGQAGGFLAIGAGASIQSAGSLSLDATGATSLAADATLGARSIDVTANRIGLTANDAARGDTGALLIGPRILAQFANSQETLLRGRSGIDVLGDVALRTSNALTLSAPTVHGDGGNASIAADTLTLMNDTGAVAGASVPGTGRMRLDARDLRLAAGDMTFGGFSNIAANAAGGFFAAGAGTSDFGAAQVDVTAPKVFVEGGADKHLATTGAMRFVAAGVADNIARAQGGKLSVKASSLDIGTSMVAAGGNLTLHATQGGIVLENGATLDVGGLSKPFNDVSVHVPAGTVTMQADQGDIALRAGSSVDIRGDAAGGNAGRLQIQATSGQATLEGNLLGSALDNYLGGTLVVDTAGAMDLGSVVSRVTAGGIDGAVSIHTRTGDLVLGQGTTLHAIRVNLTADGGRVDVGGKVDASGAFGGNIALFGAKGVDIDGTLDASASGKGQQGGDITLGTSGVGDGTLNTLYGYQNVQRNDAGHIRIGSGAHIAQDGPGGTGKFYLRAPLLTDGDVPVTVESGADLARIGKSSLEAYAVWDAHDVAGDLTKHFDGLVDPAGWFTTDPASGRIVLVAGTFTDDNGNDMGAPDPADAKQVADFLSRYHFTPDEANPDHVAFYGYAGGDASQGPGTLMGFIQEPGFTFDARLGAAIPGLAIRPGVELRNSDATKNAGNISLLTNWNLGAGTRDAAGVLHQVYRYGDQAPVLSFRAKNDLDIRASVSDGFFQDANAGGSAGAPPAIKTYQQASDAWNAVVGLGIGAELWPDIGGPPTELSGSDDVAIGQYYGQYVQYATYLVSSLPTPYFGHPADVIFVAYANQFTMPVPNAPPPPTAPTNLNAYPTYLAKYATYLNQSIVAAQYDQTGSVPDTFVALIAPPTTMDRIDTSAPVDNSPSPRAIANNPLPMLSASLTGGSSSSYRFVAGADIGSTDPMSTLGNAAGNLLLGGHTDFTDPVTSLVLPVPTLIRTGTGDIDLAAAGDIRWLDDRAPAAIYTAGAPADGTDVVRTAQLLQPSQNVQLINNAAQEQVISGAVNPVDGGHVSLKAGDNIVGQQNIVDKTGDTTGVAGTPTAQYWWQWLETNNTADRSAINFGAFDQGVMSAGGNVNVEAGGDIRQLSVSLPTTWRLDGPSSAQVLTTFGGGDLSVRAGGDILSGSFFVAKGQGDIQAGGRIGSDFTLPYRRPDGSMYDQPISTLIAMQDAQLAVVANGAITLGGIFNPSWMNISAVNAISPAGHADGQAYGIDSRIDVTALGGDLTYGDLVSAPWLFTPGLQGPSPTNDTAGDLLPATVNFTSLTGNLTLLTSGELVPSTDGNLGLLAQQSVHFDMQSSAQSAGKLGWGIVDAPWSALPSPTTIGALSNAQDTTLATIQKDGYLYSMLLNVKEIGSFLHSSTPWRANDMQPVRVYALEGDIVNGRGAGVGGVFLVPSKTARIEAGRDIVDLAYLGQHVHASDVSVIRAGRDIYDTPFLTASPGVNDPSPVLATIVQGGAGNLIVDAGRDLGHLVSQSDYYAIPRFVQSAYKFLQPLGNNQVVTGIDSVGNTYNPWLPAQGASVYASFGTAPGMDRATFIASYIDPVTVKPGGLDDGGASLVDFVEGYDAGLQVDTGLVKDNVRPNYDVAQAWARFKTLSDDVQGIFVQKTLFRILAQVGKDYNDSKSPFAGQYARGYAALNALFPAKLGYTANGLTGGENGASNQVHTGDLDIRGSTIQTQYGGDVSILGPGGSALLGSASAPPVTTSIVDGSVLDGPNTQGIITQRTGNVSMFTDGSTLLAQSRIFTEQGGDVTIWSSNGDINAGKGAKTTTEIPPARYLCTQDAWCFQDAAGQVSGAGIATLQTVPGAAEGSAYLMAPRGTVDAGDAGIRVSGNLVVAAAHVANADNVQVKGESIGLPVVQSVNVGALNAAGAAANAATKAAEDVVRQQQSDARDKMPSIISVQVVGDNPSASIDAGSHGSYGYDARSAVQVVRRAGQEGDGLTSQERAALR